MKRTGKNPKSIGGERKSNQLSKAANQKLQESEEKFRTLIESISDSFISLDKNFCFTYVNKQAGELFRRNPESLIGKNIWEEFPEVVASPAYDAYNRAMVVQQEINLKEYYQSSDIWIESHFYPSLDGLSIVIRDITENIRQEKLYILEKEVLEFYTKEKASIEDAMELLLKGIQQIHPEMLCSILKPEGGKLYTWSSPHLPQEFNNAINGSSIENGIGACGTSAFLKSKVVVQDIFSDPLTKDYKDLANQFQLKTCWSYPVLDSSQKILATFAIYYKTQHNQKKSEELTIERATTILKNIIENKIAADSLRKSEEVRRLIMNSSLDAIICINIEGIVTLWNPQAEKIFGWKEEEMIGKRMADFIIPVRYRADHEAGIKHYLKTGYGPMLNKVFEINALNRRQKEFPVELTILPVKQGVEEFFCAFIEDITERKEAQALLQRVNAQLISAQHIARLGYWELDLINNLNYWSDEVFEICGIEKDQRNATLGTIGNLIHPDDRPEFLESYDATLKGVLSLNPEFRIILKDGTIKYILIEASRVCDEDGTPIRLEGTLQDITKLKENELALIELNSELNRRAEQLAKSNADLEQFAYIASHDLQEPLRMVTSFLNQIEKRYHNLLDDKGKQYIFFAVDGAVRMRRIILDLLEYSRIGKTDSIVEEINMNQLLEEVVLLNGTAIDEKKAEIKWENLPVVRFPRTPMQQVIQNLISNGLKYHKQDQNPQIEVKAREMPSHWEFSVTDNGIGIEPQFFDKIFTLFKRLHSKEAYSGTGLGLAICKKIIENQKGKIWVESTPGVGSSFYFTIAKQFLVI